MTATTIRALEAEADEWDWEIGEKDGVLLVHSGWGFWLDEVVGPRWHSTVDRWPVEQIRAILRGHAVLLAARSTPEATDG